MNPGKSTDTVSACWCTGLEFGVTTHPDYVFCRKCGTARLRFCPPNLFVPDGNETDAGFYGRGYWFEHQKDLGFPDIRGRAREDIAGRCQHWLGTLLRYQLPPGKCLEIGCGHGGFVRLLAEIGFDAIGMEVSPTIVRMASEIYGVEIAQGTIEHTNLASATFDTVLAFDVLEHFISPETALRQIVRVLKPGGILVIQTPEYTPYHAATWRMFQPPEHVNLFSRDSVQKLLRQFGLPYVVFEPCCFEDNLFLFASSQPHPQHNVHAVIEFLQSSPQRRLVLAQQDLYEKTLMRTAESGQCTPVALGKLLGVRSSTRVLLSALLGWVTKRRDVNRG